MNIILLQDIDNLGGKFETVTVKPGYGRNYLIPKGMAIVANKTNSNMAAERLKQVQRKKDRELDDIRALVAQLGSSAIKVGAKVGTTGKIFGSVTNVQLAEAIKKTTGVDVDRRKITIADEVKTLGTYQAKIDFHRDLKHEMEFEVVAE